MEITYRNRWRDLLWFIPFLIFRSRSALLVLVLVPAIIIGPQIFVWLSQGMPLSGAEYLVQQFLFVIANMAVILVIIIVAQVLYNVVTIARARSRKAASTSGAQGDPARPLSADESRLAVSESGLLGETVRGRQQLEWARIKAIGQSKRYIMVFGSNTKAYLIPKSAFANQDDAAKFYDYCHGHWKLAAHNIAATTSGATTLATAGVKKTSRLGVASLLLAIVMPIPLAIIPATTAMGVPFEGTVLQLVSSLIFLGLLCSIAGVVLGLIALFQKNTTKVYPVFGVLFNLFLLLFVGSVVLAAMNGR